MHVQRQKIQSLTNLVWSDKYALIVRAAKVLLTLYLSIVFTTIIIQYNSDPLS